MSVSVLLLTLDEEANLPRCLDALAWCDDVVVVDSFSTDRTVEIARNRGARVLERGFDDFASQRNWGLDHGDLRHEWVLHLDADEVVEPDLRDEILGRVAGAGDGLDAFRVASKMIYRGRWLRRAGLFPSYQVRLGRRDALRFRQVGHGQRETVEPDRVGTLRGALRHHSFGKGLDEWIARHNRYSTAEARAELTAADGPEAGASLGALLRDPVARRRRLKRVSRGLPFRPTLRFLYMYVVRGGFLDGGPGLEYCRLLAMYERMIVLKRAELERGGLDRG